MKKYIIGLAIAVISSLSNASDLAQLSGVGLACPDPERSKNFSGLVFKILVDGDSEIIKNTKNVLESEYGCHLLIGIDNKNSLKVKIHKKVDDGEFSFYQFSLLELNGVKIDSKDKLWVLDTKMKDYPLFKHL